MFILNMVQTDFELGGGSRFGGKGGEECQRSPVHCELLHDAVALALNFVGDEV